MVNIIIQLLYCPNCCSNYCTLFPLDQKRESTHKKEKKETVDNTVPLLQAKQDTTDSLRLEEVQEELRKTHPLLSTKGKH